MWQHRSTENRLETLERMLQDFFRGVPIEGGSDHRILHLLIQMEKRLMSALDDAVASLTSSIASLSDAVAANDAAVQREIEALTAAVSAGDQTATNAAAQKIADLSAAVASQANAIKAETDKLTQSLPAA